MGHGVSPENTMIKKTIFIQTQYTWNWSNVLINMYTCFGIRFLCFQLTALSPDHKCHSLGLRFMMQTQHGRLIRISRHYNG